MFFFNPMQSACSMNRSARVGVYVSQEDGLDGGLLILH